MMLQVAGDILVIVGLFLLGYTTANLAIQMILWRRAVKNDRQQKK